MSPHARRVAALDPVADCEEIVRVLGTLEFAWDVEKALEFALFRTYAVPSISGLLARTGEFEARTRKRYDDTELILAEISENGIDSDRGGRAVARMNEIHGRFRISNEDMLYVLSAFVFEPPRWMARFGKRPMTEAEQEAGFQYYRRLGARMGIAGIPEDRAAFEAFNRTQEAERFAFAETNRRIGAATRDLLLGFYLPRVLVPLARPVAHAAMDEPLLDAMGFPHPSRWLRRAVEGGLRARAAALRALPARRRPRLLTRLRRPSHPGGYVIEALGPAPAGRRA